MSHFGGRVRHWLAALNPMLLLETEKSLKVSQNLLQQHRTLPLKRPPAAAAATPTDADLWQAKLAVDNCIHPTSKEVINPLFRMCMFLPMNYLILPIMMAPGTLGSTFRSAGVQWFNQSYNSAVNYANRSSDKQPVSDIFKAYMATIFVGVGGSVGAAVWLKSLPKNSVKSTVIRATVPFLAVVGASAANLAFMRKNEWLPGGQGLQVVDEDGNVRGHSVKAGRESLWKCCLARVLWNIPCMVLPIVLAIPLKQYVPIARRNPYLTEVGLQIAGITIGVPPALATFDVTQTVSVRSLEEPYWNMQRKNGQKVEYLTYYKGL